MFSEVSRYITTSRDDFVFLVRHFQETETINFEEDGVGMCTESAGVVEVQDT